MNNPTTKVQRHCHVVYHTISSQAAIVAVVRNPLLLELLMSKKKETKKTSLCTTAGVSEVLAYIGRFLLERAFSAPPPLRMQVQQSCTPSLTILLLLLPKKVNVTAAVCVYSSILLGSTTRLACL
jgi:hypothetical protein